MECSIKTTRRVDKNKYYESYAIYPSSNVLGVLIKNPETLHNEPGPYAAKGLVVTDVRVRSGLSSFLKPLISDFNNEIERLVVSHKRTLIHNVKLTLTQNLDTDQDIGSLLPNFTFEITLERNTVAALLLLVSSAISYQRYANTQETEHPSYEYENYAYWTALDKIRKSIIEATINDRPTPATIFISFKPFTLPTHNIGITTKTITPDFASENYNIKELTTRQKQQFVINNIALLRRLKTIYASLLFNYDPVVAFMILVHAFMRWPSLFPVTFSNTTTSGDLYHYFLTIDTENESELYAAGFHVTNPTILMAYNRYNQNSDASIVKELLQYSDPIPPQEIVSWPNRILHTINLITTTKFNYTYKRT